MVADTFVYSIVCLNRVTGSQYDLGILENYRFQIIRFSDGHGAKTRVYDGFVSSLNFMKIRTIIRGDFCRFRQYTK